MWLFAVKHEMGLQVERVPSAMNIADLPSREEYGVLEGLGANWVKPHMADAFCDPFAWESLSLKRRLVDSVPGLPERPPRHL